MSSYRVHISVNGKTILLHGRKVPRQTAYLRVQCENYIKIYRVTFFLHLIVSTRKNVTRGGIALRSGKWPLIRFVIYTYLGTCFIHTSG